MRFVAFNLRQSYLLIASSTAAWKANNLATVVAEKSRSPGSLKRTKQACNSPRPFPKTCHSPTGLEAPLKGSVLRARLPFT